MSTPPLIVRIFLELIPLEIRILRSSTLNTTTASADFLIRSKLKVREKKYSRLPIESEFLLFPLPSYRFQGGGAIRNILAIQTSFLLPKLRATNAGTVSGSRSEHE